MQERESDQRRRGGGGIIPFWNTAPPEDSLSSWDRGKEKWKKKKKERKQEIGMEEQGWTDMGLDGTRFTDSVLLTETNNTENTTLPDPGG